MKLKNRLLILSSIIILTLLVNLALPVTALADDETPPPAATEEPVSPPSEEEESQPVEEEPLLTEAAPEIESILEELPPQTDLVVLNQEGEVVPLASEEAAAIIEEGDPMWCPVVAGVPTLPFGAGCTASFTRFTTNSGLLNTLLVDAGATYSGPGIIYVAEGNIVAADQGKNIILDGTTLAALAGYELTIQGGWDFTGNTQTSNQSVFKNSTLQVVNWGGDVTVNNIKFNLAGITGNGLTINAIDGDVAVNNVTVTDATQSGLFIDDVDNVEINDSTFNSNDGHGLDVIADGSIDLDDVTAKTNAGNGAYLDNTNGTSDVTFTGTNTFNENGEYGLEIYSAGDITLNDVDANRNNDESGAWLNNTYGSGDVTLTGTNTFNANDEYGLYVLSNGDIDLENVTASRNIDEDGVYLDNCLWNGSACDGSGSITVNGNGSTNSFNDNGENGIEAYSAGDIDLDDVEANRNVSHGAYLYNAYGGTGDITLSDFVANFNEDGNGVFAYAADDVFLEDGYFKGNEKRGVHAQSDDGDIDIWFSEFINNGMSGLRAEAYDGDIFLYEIYSDNNGIHGANLGSGGNIFIDDSEFYDNDNSGVHIMGLYIDLFVLDSDFSDNHGHGLDAEYIGGSVDIEDSDFEDNNKNGLNLPFVEGDIDISFSDFEVNGHNGAYLYNCGCTISDITIESSDFDYNGWNGLEAYAYGEINLDGVYASGNGDVGAYLDNTYGIEDIHVDNSLFNYNGDATDEHGLWVELNGDVYLDGVTANNNYYAGASIGNYNTNSTIGGNAFIWNSTFNQNGVNGDWDGLDVFADGNVELDNVTANENGYAGAWLGETDNGANPIGGTVTILNSTFNENDEQGVYIYVTGNVSIDPSNFNNNGDYGMEVYSSGNITLQEVTASGNGDDGAYLDTNGNATICDSTFSSNNGYGVDALNVGGTFTEGNNLFSGNTSGTYDHTGAVRDCYPSTSGAGGSSRNVIIPVTGGEKIVCEAGLESITVKLSAGDAVTFPCPINEYAIVNPTLLGTLPASLDDGVDFISALTALVIRGNQPVESLEASIVVSFLIPESMKDAELAILFWDGSQWVEVDGKPSEDGLYFQTTTNLVGTFVLVAK